MAWLAAGLIGALVACGQAAAEPEPAAIVGCWLSGDWWGNYVPAFCNPAAFLEIDADGTGSGNASRVYYDICIQPLLTVEWTGSGTRFEVSYTTNSTDPNEMTCEVDGQAMRCVQGELECNWSRCEE